MSLEKGVERSFVAHISLYKRRANACDLLNTIEHTDVRV